MKTVIQTISQTRVASYNNGAGAAVIVYDILMVLPQEVAHIWSSRWSVPKVLYLLVRYWGGFKIIADFIVNAQLQESLLFCRLYLISTALTPCVILALVDIITITRLYALYDRNKRFLVVIGGIAVVLSTINFALSCTMAIAAWKTAFLGTTSLPLLGCLCAFPPLKYVMAIWINALVLSLLLFCMMCLKFRESVLGQKHSGARTVSPVIDAFVKGGAIWFFLITASLVVCMIFNQGIHGPFRQLFLPWLMVILSVSGTRLILNLREAAGQDRTAIFWESTVFLSVSAPMQGAQVSEFIVDDG